MYCTVKRVNYNTVLTGPIRSDRTRPDQMSFIRCTLSETPALYRAWKSFRANSRRENNLCQRRPGKVVGVEEKLEAPVRKPGHRADLFSIRPDADEGLIADSDCSIKPIMVHSFMDDGLSINVFRRL